MPAYLFHKPTGDFFIHTALLAERGDMQQVEADSLEEARKRVNAIHAVDSELAAAEEKPAKTSPKAKKKADDAAEDPTADIFEQT